MRHAMGPALLTVALTAPAWADDKGMEDEKLYGNWGMNSLVRRMETLPVLPGDRRLTLEKGGKAIWREMGKRDAVGTWKADTSRTPMELDITVTRDAGKGPETLKAVYMVDGDRLRVAYSLEGWGKERPKALEPKDTNVMYLTRQKP
jgi:uncharacterized protein (TIGR03067 family)